MDQRFAPGTGGSRDVISGDAPRGRWIARPAPRATPRNPWPRSCAPHCL